MRVLLDTHTVLWAFRRTSQLAKRARALLDDLTTDVLISSVSPWEMSIKQALGKMPEAEPLLADWGSCLSRLRAVPLDITYRHGIMAGGLRWAHKDPFDRMLAAQAIAEAVPLVSADSVFDSLPDVRRWWDGPTS